MFKKMFLSMCFVLLCSSLAMAVPILVGNTNDWEDIAGGYKDDIEDVNSMIFDYSGSEVIPYPVIVRLNEVEIDSPPDQLHTMLFNFTEGADYISFKYNGDFELWYIGGADSVTWSALDYDADDIHALSHYREWSTVAPVPEPATMFLLGTGLLGIGAVSRKKLKK